MCRKRNGKGQLYACSFLAQSKENKRMMQRFLSARMFCFRNDSMNFDEIWYWRYMGVQKDLGLSFCPYRSSVNFTEAYLEQIRRDISLFFSVFPETAQKRALKCSSTVLPNLYNFPVHHS
jgi:hypothetical protein